MNQGPETIGYQLSCNLVLGSRFCATRARSCLVLGYLCNADTGNRAGAAVRSKLASCSQVAQLYSAKQTKTSLKKGIRLVKGNKILKLLIALRVILPLSFKRQTKHPVCITMRTSHPYLPSFPTPGLSEHRSGSGGGGGGRGKCADHSGEPFFSLPKEK